MKILLYILGALGLLALASWAYMTFFGAAAKAKAAASAKAVTDAVTVAATNQNTGIIAPDSIGVPDHLQGGINGGDAISPKVDTSAAATDNQAYKAPPRQMAPAMQVIVTQQPATITAPFTVKPPMKQITIKPVIAVSNNGGDGGASGATLQPKNTAGNVPSAKPATAGTTTAPVVKTGGLTVVYKKPIATKANIG